MAEEREPILMCVAGKKRVGKTYTTTKSIDDYVRPKAGTGKQPRKVLIYDVNMEYVQYKAIDVKDIGKFTRQKRIEVRRVLPIGEDGKPCDLNGILEILSKIISTYRGGMLLLEDINRYLIQSKTVDVIGMLCTNAHRDLDIICHFQSLAALDPRMWQNTTFVRWHMQSDNIDRYRQRIPNYELFKIAQLLVRYKYLKLKDIRFYCFVSVGEDYITGNFTRQDFRHACRMFLETEHTKISRTAKRFGKGEEARVKAINHLTSELEQVYYRGI